jgi:hypothetical protein
MLPAFNSPVGAVSSLIPVKRPRVFEPHAPGKIALCEWSKGCQILCVTKLVKTGPPTSVAKHDFKTLKKAVRKFAAERDWDKLHSPKNLTMALIGETAEIIEHFQWLSSLFRFSRS